MRCPVRENQFLNKAFNSFKWAPIAREAALRCLPVRARDGLIRCMDCNRHMSERCDACFSLAEDGSDESCSKHTPWEIEFNAEHCMKSEQCADDLHCNCPCDSCMVQVCHRPYCTCSRRHERHR